MTTSTLIRAARRLACLTAVLSTVLVCAPLTASAAEIGDKGSPDPLSVAEKLAYFVGIPLLVLVVCMVIFMRPGSGGATRYRPQRGWEADDAWFGITAPASTTAVAATDVSPAADGPETGGSRGSW